MDQLDPLGVDDAEPRWSGQEDLRPVLMGPEETKQAGALRELGKQRAIVAGQPPIKGAVAHPFERMQQSQGGVIAPFPTEPRGDTSHLANIN